MTKNNKVLKAIEEAEEIDYDKDGNAVISISVKSKEDFYYVQVNYLYFQDLQYVHQNLSLQHLTYYDKIH